MMNGELTLQQPNYNNSVPSGALGMVILLFTELMFFVGLISAYIVNRAGVANWPPSGQPRLPIEITGVNTIFLLTSALTIFLFYRKYRTDGNAKSMLLLTIGLGVLFLGIQGFEWVKLLGFGLTTTSSLYGSFFYGIIGVHAFHVVIGVFLLFYLLNQYNKAEKSEIKGKVIACSMYWYFVVGIWPVLYFLVYLY
ncbi:MAG: heme-copper oxidase subunit III [Bacteroidetes bacterium]|nr:heme-copper oxidase subunit III [Bacteroidota bacterium]